MRRARPPAALLFFLLLATSAFGGVPLPFHHFAHIGDGEQGQLWMRTTFLIMNQNQSEAEITLRFFGNTGSPLELTVEGGAGSVYTDTIPPEGMLLLKTQGPGPR